MSAAATPIPSLSASAIGYVDIAARIGFREDAVSRGIATGDVDGDGRA